MAGVASCKEEVACALGFGKGVFQGMHALIAKFNGFQRSYPSPFPDRGEDT
jgi:hypothetical protein